MYQYPFCFTNEWKAFKFCFQLRTNTVEDAKTQLEHLQLAYTNSQSQIQAVQAALEEARNEKQQLDFEYKSFTTQLVNDMEHMKEKVRFC